MEPIRFSTEDGVSLEGELRLPDGPPRGSAVICHAHPRHGGSKDHPVLWAIRNALAQRGFAVLTFNFRGTMRSGGVYAGGHGEVRDVRAAIGRVREEAEGLPTVVAGWSFGANVALREAIDDERVAALALVGIPLGEHELDVPELPSASELHAFRRRVLLLAGEGDVYCPSGELRALGKDLGDADVVILPGTDHFLWRREKEASARIGTYAEAILNEDTRAR